MTANKRRKYISLAMLIVGLIAFIALIVVRVCCDKIYGTWQYIVAPLWIAFFAVMYRNFTLAVRDDEKYGPVK